MKYEIISTDNFSREFKKLSKKYTSLKSDFSKLLTLLEENPVTGTPLAHNCFKIRMAISSKGKGKSGGARLITQVYVSAKLVYLLSIYDKSEKSSLTDKEIKNLIESIRPI